MDKYLDILKLWKIEEARLLEGAGFLNEHSNKKFRKIFEDNEGEKYLLESISAEKIVEEEERCRYLELVAQGGSELKIISYLKNSNDNYFEKYEDFFVGVVKFVDGVAIDQFKYLDECWRAVVAANFLIDLSEASSKTSTKNIALFSLKNFINDFVIKMEKYNNKEYLEVQSIFKYLEKDFFLKYDDLPKSFCHGDFHIFNMIWNNKKLLAVIDWEFSSYCVEFYDAAFFVGCLGMENPAYLKKNIVLKFIKKLQESKKYKEESWKYFFDLFLAIRFLWLAQWLKFNNQEMIWLEIDYLNLIFNNKEEILKKWNLK